MTAHPIDTEALRREALGQLGLAAMDPRWPGRVLSILDALAAAEHRATRAEARTKVVRELHYPAHNNQGRAPFCPDCKGAPGVHECGCWRDKQETPVCGHCRGWKGVGPVEWPCPTIRALDGDDGV